MARYRLKTDMGRCQKGEVRSARSDGWISVKGRSGCDYVYNPCEFPQLFEKIDPKIKVSYVQVGEAAGGETVFTPFFVESLDGCLRMNEGGYTVIGRSARVFERREEQVEE